MFQTVNMPVDVLSYYFSGGVHSYPSRIAVDGRELNFIENGLRCLVKKGQEIIQIFNMSDGTKQYRLMFEPTTRLWTLLSIKRAQA